MMLVGSEVDSRWSGRRFLKLLKLHNSKNLRIGWLMWASGFRA